LEKRSLKIISDMADFLTCPKTKSYDVILEGSPVISFGDFKRSRLATLGLNPSDQEFYNSEGEELDGVDRRFHTLKSLDIKSWKDLDVSELKKIMFTCENYFQINPYDRWFKPLNYLMAGTGYSYYDMFNSACHLDLVPFATKSKWGNLPEQKKKKLLEIGARFLADIINVGEIEVLIMNGKSVVSTLEKISETKFNEKNMSSWKLPRREGHVPGISYTATLNSIGSTNLKRPIKILGFNHNIQSSFGVTNEVKASIKSWVTRKVNTV